MYFYTVYSQSFLYLIILNPVGLLCLSGQPVFKVLKKKCAALNNRAGQKSSLSISAVETRKSLSCLCKYQNAVETRKS